MSDIISLISLIVAIFSAAYTWEKSQPSIHIVDYKNNFDREHNRISFTITNTSTVPIFVEDIKLMKDNKIINELDFDIDKYDLMKHDQAAEAKKQRFKNESISVLGVEIPPVPSFSKPFIPSLDKTSQLRQTLLVPYESISFDTFVDELPDKITVCTDKRLHYFSKQKSVFIKNK
ncbi:hypothetical protein GHU05_04835 [Fructobacillus tropaeoli]|uniref:hypothetical protein n=1 Tax=Fructobacillus tropaeoli TaxID=709323 RepID=UPI001455DF5D|nr:hypothetical protein [Fructobacillus tropaeoli]NLS38253.1 hypothetical protein [Fructobacillus tropaeoli]